jgi:predicted nucleic acid-binding protein
VGRLVSSSVTLFCNNYVVVETLPLLQHRLGIKGVRRAFNDDVRPLVNVQWVEKTTHKAGVSVLEAAGRRRLSPVDCVNFETMRQLRIKTAFTFDPHSSEQGFQCVP